MRFEIVCANLPPSVRSCIDATDSIFHFDTWQKNTNMKPIFGINSDIPSEAFVFLYGRKQDDRIIRSCVSMYDTRHKDSGAAS